ncbi:MAG: DUF932 domain-containing protein [Fibrobacteria bacterium]|nr:DUF932 domain-containing protein [Fibrobacteria bacterium]
MGLIKLNSIRTAEEALAIADLNWSVRPVPLITGEGKDVPTHKGLTRSDTGNILGIVGKSYQPIQNFQAFAFADILAEHYGATYEYAGMCKDGKKVFLQAKLNESFEATRGDQVDCYITMATSHDGSSSMRVFLTPIRLFCENQLIRAIKNASTNIVLRHTVNAEIKMQQAFEVFATSRNAFLRFKQKAQYLAQKQVDREMVKRFLDSVVGPEDQSTRIRNNRETVTRLFENGKGNHGQNAFQMYNAATEWVDHERTRDPEKRLESAMFGSGAIIKEKAFAAAMAL